VAGKDLGSVKNIYKVKLTHWENLGGGAQYYYNDDNRYYAWYSFRYYIQTSTDNVNWSTMAYHYADNWYGQDSDRKPTTTIAFPPTQARYIRIYYDYLDNYASDNEGDYERARLKEFEIYDVSSRPPLNTKIVASSTDNNSREDVYYGDYQSKQAFL